MSQKVTEEEAKSKWCRHGFVAVQKLDHRGACAASANRKDAACRCLGSECMDWEWASGPDGQGDKRVGFCDAQRGL